MPASSALKSRQWCFTVWGDAVGKIKLPTKAFYKDWSYEYIYVGEEIGPVCGRKHHQGYIRFTNPRALGGMKKLHRSAHWAACKGTEAENVRYCSKDGVLVIEDGERMQESAIHKEQGKRRDIEDVRDLIRQGAGMRQICNEARSYQSLRGGELLLKYLERERKWDTKVTWIYGSAGCGKSRAVQAAVKPEAYWCMKSSKWFEGYDANEDVVIDDFSSEWCSYKEFLRLTDRYPFRVEVKGGSRQWLAKRIFITCDKPPHQTAWVGLNPNDWAQIGRRIDTIYFMSPDGKTYGAPGSTIGIEPSVEQSIPELGPEQEVGGNTTEPSTPPSAEEQGPAPTCAEFAGDLDSILEQILNDDVTIVRPPRQG